MAIENEFPVAAFCVDSLIKNRSSDSFLKKEKSLEKKRRLYIFYAIFGTMAPLISFFITVGISSLPSQNWDQKVALMAIIMLFFIALAIAGFIGEKRVWRQMKSTQK